MQKSQGWSFHRKLQHQRLGACIFYYVISAQRLSTSHTPILSLATYLSCVWIRLKVLPPLNVWIRLIKSLIVSSLPAATQQILYIFFVICVSRRVQKDVFFPRFAICGLCISTCKSQLMTMVPICVDYITYR